MMALSGVRSSCETLARNSDLMRLASSALSFSTAYFSASSTSCCACFSSCWRERRRSATVAVSARSFSSSCASFCFSAVMSVPTETKPPSFGAPLVDLQPAAVLDARLHRARAGAVVGVGKRVGDDRPAAAPGDLGVGRAGLHELVGEAVELLVLAVAEDQAVGGIPEHEGLGDRLDGVAQAEVGGARGLGEAPLLGHVDGDADQVRLVLRVRRPPRRARGSRSSARRRGACGTRGRTALRRPRIRPSASATRSASSGW